MVPCAVIQQDLIAYSVSCYAVEGRSSIGNRGRGTEQNKFRPLRAQPQTSEKGYAMVSWHLFWRPIPASMWMSVSIVQKKQIPIFIREIRSYSSLSSLNGSTEILVLVGNAGTSLRKCIPLSARSWNSWLWFLSQTGLLQRYSLDCLRQ